MLSLYEISIQTNSITSASHEPTDLEYLIDEKCTRQCDDSAIFLKSLPALNLQPQLPQVSIPQPIPPSFLILYIN